MKSKSLVIGIAVLIVVVGGGILLLGRKAAHNTTSGSSTSSSSSQHSAAVITFDGNSFSPASMTVKSGATITIKNTSADDLQMDSNPHPVHTDDTDLNVGEVAPGQSATFTVTKKGIFGYHNHLDPGVGGKITIQ